MPHTSLNPRDSTLSTHAFSIMRPLLRRIALSHRDGVTTSSDTTFDLDKPDESYESEDNTVTQRLQALATPLRVRLDQPYSAAPAAKTMTAQEIAADIADGNDPWADEAGTHRNNSLIRPPIKSMLTAARFAALLTDAYVIDMVTARRACTLITVPGTFNHRTLNEEINAILEWLADIAQPSWQAWRGFGVIVLDADGKQQSTHQQDNQRQSIEYAVKNDRKILAFLYRLKWQFRICSGLSAIFP